MSWRSVIGLLRGPQFRLAVAVKALQHLGRGEIGQQLADRLVERQLALLDQLHRRRRIVIGLGHRGDPEHAVGRSSARSLDRSRLPKAPW